MINHITIETIVIIILSLPFITILLFFEPHEVLSPGVSHHLWGQHLVGPAKS